jgi:phage terminase large subunit-like protein
MDIQKNNHLKEVIKYCNDIIRGKILSGVYTKKAVKRFLSDLKRQNDEDFLYEFNEDKFIEVVEFAESLIIPDIDTADKKLKLLPWMKFIYANLYGFIFKIEPERRRFRSGYV